MRILASFSIAMIRNFLFLEVIAGKRKKEKLVIEGSW